MTYSTSQKSRRKESTENNTSLSFSEMKQRKQIAFAENKHRIHSSDKTTVLQDLELDQRDSEMKWNFHDKTSDLSQSRIDHFEQVSMWNSWNDSEKSTQLAMGSRGRALRVLNELTHRELSNYSELKNALSQRFSPADRDF